MQQIIKPAETSYVWTNVIKPAQAAGIGSDVDGFGGLGLGNGHELVYVASSAQLPQLIGHLYIKYNKLNGQVKKGMISTCLKNYTLCRLSFKDNTIFLNTKLY